MISRYTRRPVSHSLEIRGLSRSNLDHHPLPEEADGYLPKYPLHDRQEALSTCNSSEASGECGRSSVTTSETERSWSGIHSYSGTGISTERSSVFSWGYDEFDKAASRQVQRMFEEIDEELYECQSDGQLGGLQEECQQWATRFPHLRILGTQLVCPTDDGYRWFSITEMGAARDATSTVDDKTVTELSVHGRKATLSRLGVEAEHNCASDERPRIIEAEGLMEEYLAFDSRDLDEDWERDCVGSGRHRYWLPPVSPYRCRRQAILDLLFDDVWRELVGWTGELISRHWEGCISDEEKNTVSLSPVQPEPRDPYSTLPTVLPRLGQSRLPQLTASLQLQSNRVPVGAAVTHQNLNDLIVIHGIPLQQRNLGVSADKTQDTEERVSHRPSSSVIASSKQHSRRALEQSSSSLLRPAQSARRRNPPPRTLLPLVPGPMQPSTAGPMDEGIRGTRLVTVSDRQVSPPMPLSRNSLLPPIGVGDIETSYISQHLRPGLRQRGHANSRAHSAVVDEGGASVPRDRLHLLDIFSRPNTTHTYRSDTPYRRSFTILDNIGLSRTGRASVGTDSLDIGVTGISLGISSSSFLDSFMHHAIGQSPTENEEAPPPALLVPVSVPARSHNRGGLTSRSSRPGL
ncbi:protein FAM149B1 isoform X2 [Brienomyrus brachyistius]|uniref:protein FAM149B1 isoform X2 n=1 Tax=Brienomyrus brachyistius TaxID=42636 RepID=UPI0020B36483|nr:protein FAM149B1 isoform X2 [Brienomyrus brachyistius]